MDPTQQQLHNELETSIKLAHGKGRPILTHLNADTTWLIQLPSPAVSSARTGRAFFNILIDPWLKGPQSDIASWFSTQRHLIQSSIQTIAELEHNLREIQRLVSIPQEPSSKKESNKHPTSYIDAVAVSHEFTDHCHQATLLEIDPDVPVFATEKAAELIRSWKHFKRVLDTPALSQRQSDWRKTSVLPLPSWVGISRIVTEGNQLYYHSAICITFVAVAATGDNAEAIIYSPHGIVADDLRHLPRARPEINTLALLHGLHDVGITGMKQLNLGGHNGLRAQRICKARYWLGTHDEIKEPGGILAPFLRRSVISIQDALKQEKDRNGHVPRSSMLADMEDANFLDLGSGESLLLV
ncbi:MAG: hypothetical protein LQ340_003698 [Diploschistes diacapsis]|nr:MAG: hypothetical protein LQ340_003698 [Diploschistes diacapsis]